MGANRLTYPIVVLSFASHTCEVGVLELAAGYFSKDANTTGADLPTEATVSEQLDMHRGNR